MKEGRELIAFIDDLDAWQRGALSADEIKSLEDRINADPELERVANEHGRFIGALREFDNRRKLLNTLEDIHSELMPDSRAEQVIQGSRMFSGNYKIWGAIAASIALVITGSLFTMVFFRPHEEANYREVRRNIEQIKKSQTLILADLALTKGKSIPSPGKYAGTGFMISSNGYVATNYHVVKDADSLAIENITGRFPVDLVFKDLSNDLAILRIRTQPPKSSALLPFLLLGEEANLGENVYTLGFPREDLVFGEGAISAATGFHENPNAYQISIPVNPGNSGGPLLNTRGDVIGIITGIQTETAGAAFAIKSTVLLEFLKTCPVDSSHEGIRLSRQNKNSLLSRVDQVKGMKKYVFMVRVFK